MHDFKNGQIVFFLHDNELIAGKIFKKSDDKFHIFTYTNKRLALELEADEISPTFDSARKSITGVTSIEDVEEDKLIDIMRYLNMNH